MSDLDNINPPSILEETGTLHPINQTKDYLLKLLAGLGFKEVHGPEIETEEVHLPTPTSGAVLLCPQVRRQSSVQHARPAIPAYLHSHGELQAGVRAAQSLYPTLRATRAPWQPGAFRKPQPCHLETPTSHPGGLRCYAEQSRCDCLHQ